MKKGELSQFIGRQLSRLKAGQSYYMIVMTTITALSLVNIAFPDIDTMFLIILFPCVLFGAYLIGYFMDKTNVVSMDMMKTVEMAHRYINIADLKLFEFYLALMKGVIKMEKGKEINFKELDNEYRKYVKRWSPKKEDAQ